MGDGVGAEAIAARLACAEACAIEAGVIILRSIRHRDESSSTLSFRTKGSIVDPVTDVDEECERLIVSKIMRAFPDDTVIAEEGHNEEIDAQLAKARWAWVIDPIDGTRNFLHCLPNVSVSIGLVQAGTIVAGVVHAPVFGETYSASLGNGAHLNGRRISVSAVREVSCAAISTDINCRDPQVMDRTLAQWRALLAANTQNLRIRGSAALELCSVACGRLDGHLEEGLDVWDVCAAALIVREAGGVVWGGGQQELRLQHFDGAVQAANSLELGQQIAALLKTAALPQVSKPPLHYSPPPELILGSVCVAFIAGWAARSALACSGAS
jgi:myo-inositol-1(or 4)-monophosphatase